MKLPNESHLNELMKFKEDFNQKLQSAYKIYEERSKTFGNSLNIKENNKENSSTKLKTSQNIKKSKNLPKINKPSKETKTKLFKSPFTIDADIDSIKIRKVGRGKLNIMSNTWKPQFMVCDYFEPYKRLKNNYEMSTWEIVIIYIFIDI